MPRYKYETAVLCASDADAEKLELNDAERSGSEMIVCDLSNENLPEAQHETWDLLVLDRVLSRKKDKKAYLEKLRPLLVKQGFVKVIEYTRHNAVVNIVQTMVNINAGSVVTGWIRIPFLY